MANAIRRSKRERKVNKRYTNDGWDEKTLRLLHESDSIEPHVVDDGELEGQVISDDEFIHHGEQDIVMDEDSSSEVRSVVSSRIATAVASDDDRSIISATSSLSGRENQRQRQRRLRLESTRHARGLQDAHRRLGKSAQWQVQFGPEIEDLQPTLAGRDRWVMKGRDAAIPSLSTVNQAIQEDWLPSRISHDQISNLMSTVTRSQQLQPITLHEAETEYISGNLAQKVVLGPSSAPEVYDLYARNSVSLSSAWKKDKTIPVQTQSVTLDKEKQDSSPCWYKGWVINTGSKIQSLAWAPQAEVDDMQYLAVVCQSSLRQRTIVSQPNMQHAPAFSASAGYPAAIQLWEFTTAQRNRDQHAEVDPKVQPHLCEVLGCNFGDIRELKWAPRNATQSALGTLAIISTDGQAHLVDIPRPRSAAEGPSCFKVVRTAINLRPPQGSIFTTCCFASTTDLVVGMSDGAIKLYDLGSFANGLPLQPYATHQIHLTYVLGLSTAGTGEDSHFLASSSAASDIRLTDLRAPIQDSMHLPRARQPTKNLVYSSHARSWVTTVDSSGRTDAFKASGTRVVAHSLRYFHSATQVGRFPQDGGSATALASSQLHPYILTGSSQGTVMCQNLLRRVLPTGTSHKSGAWTQKLCQYDWVSQAEVEPDTSDGSVETIMTIQPHENVSERAAVSNSETKSANSAFHKVYYGKDTRSGVSRFYEGFRPEKQDLSHGAATNAKAKDKGKGKGKAKAKAKPKTKQPKTNMGNLDGDDELEDLGAEESNEDETEAPGDWIAEIIYEEEQAVTAIAWNENPRFATWAAIGWGSGILRVQDISHSAK